MSNGRLNEDRKRGGSGEDGARRVKGRRRRVREEGWNGFSDSEAGVSAFNEEKPQEGFA